MPLQLKLEHMAVLVSEHDIAESDICEDLVEAETDETVLNWYINYFVIPGETNEMVNTTR